MHCSDVLLFDSDRENVLVVHQQQLDIVIECASEIVFNEQGFSVDKIWIPIMFRFLDKENITVRAFYLKRQSIFSIRGENCIRAHIKVVILITAQLDDVLKYARGEWIKQLNISSRNAEINKERREKLGTKG